LTTYKKLQRDTGFNMDFLEKAYHITRILSGIFSHRQIKEDVALKGGTALNFIYLNVPRISVDLDFNFIRALEKEEIIRKRAEVSKEILKLADSLGYRVSKRPESYIMERLLLKYRRLNGLPDSIRIEINYLERVPVIRTVQKSFDRYRFFSR